MDEEVKEEPQFGEPVRVEKEEDYVPFERFDDFEERQGERLWLWAAMYDEDKQRMLLAEHFSSVLGDTKGKSATGQVQERINKEVEANILMNKKNAEIAKEGLREADQIAIVSRNFWSPRSVLSFLFNENDLKVNGGYRDSAVSTVTIADLIQALNLSEDKKLFFLNSMLSGEHNYGPTSFLQNMATISRKRVGSRSREGASMEYLPMMERDG